MEFSANFEVKSEASAILDNEELRIQHPKNLFRARIKNIVRNDRSTPFLLSFQITFDAPGLQEAKDIGHDLLLDCLNMLSFTTGCSFMRHRTRLIAPAKNGRAMSECLAYAKDIGHEDPEPILEPILMQSIERLLQFDAPPAIQRALRWYRRGIYSEQPEDQFQYFWFALEILAEHEKPTARVTDKCPDCKSDLYCDTCKKHPTHRMYAKQAIRALIENADQKCKQETIEALEETRNRLMHGATLKEIEERLSAAEPEDLVDVLGRIVFKALLHQFPREIFQQKIYMASPSTYVHRTMTGIFHISTIMPTDDTGELSMEGLTGTTIDVVSDWPPQSALPFVIEMTAEQLTRLRLLACEKTEHREMLDRVLQKVQQESDKILSLVCATDMSHIEKAVKEGDSGGWQDLFREIVTKNRPKLYRPRH